MTDQKDRGGHSGQADAVIGSEAPALPDASGRPGHRGHPALILPVDDSESFGRVSGSVLSPPQTPAKWSRLVGSSARRCNRSNGQRSREPILSRLVLLLTARTTGSSDPALIPQQDAP